MEQYVFTLLMKNLIQLKAHIDSLMDILTQNF